MMEYKILVTDGLDSQGIGILTKKGVSENSKSMQAYHKKIGPSALALEISGYDALIVRSATKVTQEIISAGASGLLKIIGRAGVGYDNIDTDSAAEYGIPVIIAPNGNTNAAAELTIGLMLSLARNIPQATEKIRKGVWKKKEFEGCELKGKTIGIIGCGRIGKRVAHIVRHGFDMNVLGYDIAQEENGEIKYVSIDELIKSSDFVSVHTTGTAKIIGKEEIEIMKPTAYLINLSRGKSIDEIALYNALKEEKIAGAALDVFEKEGKEGKEWKNPLTGLDNFIGLPHLGASTKEAQNQTSVEIAKKIADYLWNGVIEGGVNIDDLDLSYNLDRDLHSICRVVHEYKPGMLAQMAMIFGSSNIDIVDMPSRILKGTKNKKALTQIIVDSVCTPEAIVNKIKEISGVQRVVVG